MNLLSKTAVAAVAMAWAGSAMAVPIAGSLSIADGANETGQSLLTRTSFTVPNPTTQSGNAGNFASVPFGQAVTMPTFMIPGAVGGSASSSSFQFSFQGGSFVASTATKTDQSATPNSNESITVFFLGTFTPAGTLSAFGPSAASVIGNFNRSFSGTNASVSSAFTLAAPPGGGGGGSGTPVPEPASIALLGVGLLGLGIARRRKAN